MSRSPRTTVAAGIALTLALAGAASTTATAAPKDKGGDQAGPKNVIMLIGDGMGYTHVDAASLWQYGTTYHQLTHDPATGKTSYVEGTPSQVFERFPVQTWMSTYSANGAAGYDAEKAWADFDYVKAGATDSAAAGTALATGVKTKNGVLGLDAQGNRVTNMVEVAEAAGKASGVVSSVPFSHATPSAYAVHTQSRNDYHEIANQMIESGLDVIIGGGHPFYDNDAQPRDPSYTWISERDFDAVSDFQTKYTYVEDARQFERLAANKPLTGKDYAPGQKRGDKRPEQLFGLVKVAETLQYNRAGAMKGVEPYEVPFIDTPDLDTLSLAALNVLERDDDGFFLMVEGGAIDWAGHANSISRDIEETVEFNKAVEATVDWVEKNSSWDETLLVVTADHETGYLAGPGADPTWTVMTGVAGDNPAHSYNSGNHTNQLVPVYAIGAGAEAITKASTLNDPVLGRYLDNTDLAKIQLAQLQR